MAFVLKQTFDRENTSIISALDNSSHILYNMWDDFTCPDDQKWVLSSYVYVKIHENHRNMVRKADGFIEKFSFPYKVKTNLVDADFGMLNSCRIIIDNSLDPERTFALVGFALDSKGTMGTEFMIEHVFHEYLTKDEPPIDRKKFNEESLRIVSHDKANLEFIQTNEGNA